MKLEMTVVTAAICRIESKPLLLVVPFCPVLLRLLLTRQEFVSDDRESLLPEPNNPIVNFTSLSQCTNFIKSRHVTNALTVVMATNRRQLHFPEHVNSLHRRKAIVLKHVKILGKTKEL